VLLLRGGCFPARVITAAPELGGLLVASGEGRCRGVEYRLHDCRHFYASGLIA
jgi:hypothetical protein